MARSERLICTSDALEDGGDAVRFTVDARGEARPAFAVRFAGRVRAYVNVCPHQGTELDWMPGRVFDDDRRYLICATHGALFDPANGRCVAGPCRGASLRVIEADERDGAVYVSDPGA